MANQYYQFAFAFSPPSLATSFQAQGANAWTPYQEPNYNEGQSRRGGPNPSGGGGNYLVASAGDTIFINLVGPAGWTMPAGSVLQVIITQANSPASSQGFSPFANGYVYYPFAPTAMQPDGRTMQFQMPSPIQASANPGQGNFNRYEITVAFTAADTSGHLYYLSDDPEMDVQGTSGRS